MADATHTHPANEATLRALRRAEAAAEKVVAGDPDSTVDADTAAVLVAECRWIIDNHTRAVQAWLARHVDHGGHDDPDDPYPTLVNGDLEPMHQMLSELGLDDGQLWAIALIATAIAERMLQGDL